MSNKSVALNELVYEKGVLSRIYEDSAPTPVPRAVGVYADCDVVATDYPNPTIYAEEDYGWMKFYYRPADFVVDQGEMKVVLNSLVCGGNCAGYDVKRLSGGEITVYFNPACHNKPDRQNVIKEVSDTLRHSWLH